MCEKHSQTTSSLQRSSRFMALPAQGRPCFLKSSPTALIWKRLLDIEEVCTAVLESNKIHKSGLKTCYCKSSKNLKMKNTFLSKEKASGLVMRTFLIFSILRWNMELK